MTSGSRGDWRDQRLVDACAESHLRVIDSGVLVVDLRNCDVIPKWKSAMDSARWSYELSKRELALVAASLLVPIPLFAASGLNVPLPGFVERGLASLAPGGIEASSIRASKSHGVKVVSRGEAAGPARASRKPLTGSASAAARDGRRQQPKSPTRRGERPRGAGAGAAPGGATGADGPAPGPSSAPVAPAPTSTSGAGTSAASGSAVSTLPVSPPSPVVGGSGGSQVSLPGGVGSAGVSVGEDAIGTDVSVGEGSAGAGVGASIEPSSGASVDAGTPAGSHAVDLPVPQAPEPPAPAVVPTVGVGG
jgi:hypothetical protein